MQRFRIRQDCITPGYRSSSRSKHALFQSHRLHDILNQALLHLRHVQLDVAFHLHILFSRPLHFVLNVLFEIGHLYSVSLVTCLIPSGTITTYLLLGLLDPHSPPLDLLTSFSSLIGKLSMNLS